jgi:NADPH:quinone reductase-like Zn-dependent oxidoreductase
MRAAILTDYDSPPRPGEFDQPGDPPDGAVAVDVHVAGLNPIDITTAAGILPSKPPLPSVVGREGIGTTADGSRVYFDASIPPCGSMAERTLAAADSLIDVPGGVEDSLALCFGIAGLAAWLGLEWTGRIREGETVLVLGASGVVGQIAVQAARLLGAGTVIAAARDEQALEHACAELGADEAVRLGSDDAGTLTEQFRDAAPSGGGGGLDLVIDPVWGTPAMGALAALNERGRLVQIGNSAGPTTEVPARTIRNNLRSIVGHHNFSAPHEVKASAFEAMCRHAAEGNLNVPVEEVQLDDIEDAWRRQKESPRRKLVVRIATATP